jgi:hypothetical protein
LARTVAIGSSCMRRAERSSGRVRLAAGSTLLVASGLLELAHDSGPYVNRREFSGRRLTGEDLGGLRALQRGDHGRNRIQYACRLTGWLRSSRRFRIHASQTGGFFRRHRHYDSITSYSASIDPWNAAVDCKIIYQVTRFEVVAPIQDDVAAFQQIFDVRWREIDNVSLHIALRVDAAEMRGGGGSLGQRLPYIGFRIEPLPLQVAFFDVIAVDEQQPSNTGAGHGSGVETSEGAAANDRDGGCEKPLLTSLAHRGKANLARIPFALAGSHTPRC